MKIKTHNNPIPGTDNKFVCFSKEEQDLFPQEMFDDYDLTHGKWWYKIYTRIKIYFRKLYKNKKQ